MLKLIHVAYYVPSTDDSTPHFDFNPLSPFINIQILHTDLLTFLKDLIERIWLKDQSILSLVIILLILMTFSLDFKSIL